MGCNPHIFSEQVLEVVPPRHANPGDHCIICGIKFCPIAYDHTYDVDYCAVCGWENEGGSFW